MPFAEMVMSNVRSDSSVYACVVVLHAAYCRHLYLYAAAIYADIHLLEQQQSDAETFMTHA